MFGKTRKTTTPQPFGHIDGSTLKSAKEGSEILYGLARELDPVDNGSAYPEQVRRAARAVLEILDSHPLHDRKQQREDGQAATEHASEIRRRFANGSFLG